MTVTERGFRMSDSILLYRSSYYLPIISFEFALVINKWAVIYKTCFYCVYFQRIRYHTRPAAHSYCHSIIFILSLLLLKTADSISTQTYDIIQKALKTKGQVNSAKGHPHVGVHIG